MSSCASLPCSQRAGQPCSRLCWTTFSRFNGHHRYKTIKRMLHSYTFMVTVNLPIKVKEQSSAFLPLVKLQSIRQWRQCGGGRTVFPICQLLDRQQQTVNQSPLRRGWPSPCSEQTNHRDCVCVCIHPDSSSFASFILPTSLSGRSSGAKFEDTVPIK